jgi:hypothetical protein
VVALCKESDRLVDVGEVGETERDGSGSGRRMLSVSILVVKARLAYQILLFALCVFAPARIATRALRAGLRLRCSAIFVPYSFYNKGTLSPTDTLARRLTITHPV